MRVNADFSKRVLIATDAMAWSGSPSAGVERKPLDRIGDEVARATTIVRFAPGSAFAPHTHDGGEEYLVLEGVFEDESGAFPAGSYVRNPPTSRHRPASSEGCTIFVKLWQFDPDDRQAVALDTNAARPEPDPARPGVGVAPLFADARETVRLEQWAPGTEAAIDAPGGAEILVLAGAGEEAGEALGPRAWLRLPPGYRGRMAAGPDGMRLWVKTGHLTDIRAPAAAQ